MMIAEMEPNGFFQGAAFKRQIEKLASKLNMNMITCDRQAISFCNPHRILFVVTYKLFLNIKFSQSKVNLKFTLQLSHHLRNTSIPMQNIYQFINQFNNSQIRTLKVCYCQENQTIICCFDQHFNFHSLQIIPNLFQMIRLQFQSLQKYLAPLLLKQEIRKKIEQFQNNINSIKNIYEQKRKRNCKSSKLQLLKKQNSYDHETAQQHYFSLKKSCLKRMKKRQESHHRIYRLMQIYSQELADFKLKSGNFSSVSLVKNHYKVFNLGSLHQQTNQSIQKYVFEQSLKISQFEKEIKQNSFTLKPHIGQVKQNKSEKDKIFQPESIELKQYLVVKSAKENERQSIINQFTILSSLRNKKCPAINYFFSQIDTDIKKIETKKLKLYSDYHKNDMNFAINKKKNCLLIMQNLAEGFLFLSEQKIIHRDIKPDNILLTQKFEPKIIDFGSANFSNLYRGQRAGLSTQLKTTRKYNIFYSDLPQQIQYNYNRFQFEHSPFFDIHAFGTIILNVFQQFLTRHQLGNLVYETLVWISHACIRLNPEDRPQAIDVYVFIKQIIAIVAEFASNK